MPKRTSAQPAKITGFVRFALGDGEGIEKEESDFAAEVAVAGKPRSWQGGFDACQRKKK